MKLENIIAAFLKDVCAGKSNETPRAYRSKLRHLEKFLGPECEYIDQEGIDRFRCYLLERDKKRRGGKEIKGKLSKFTIRSVLATTAHLLKWAGAKGYIPQGLELMNIREPQPEPKAIEELTVAGLLKAAEQEECEWERARDIALLYTLRDTGGRAGAIANIDIDDLHLEEGYATAKDKGDQLTWLWLNPPTITAIRAWLAYRDLLNPQDYKLFTGARGSGLTRQGIARVLSRLADAAGVTGRHNPHSFRHAFARDALLAGADLGQVSQMMSHKSIVVTHNYYARWHTKELKEFHNRYSPGRKLPKIRQGSAKP